MYTKDWEPVFETLNDFAAKEMLVIWTKVPAPSWTSKPLDNEPWLSVPQEKVPVVVSHKSLEVRAVSQSPEKAVPLKAEALA